MTDVFKIGIEGLCRAYKVDFFKHGKNGFDYLKTLCSFQSTVSVLNSLYDILIREGKCVPIEMLETDEKTALWHEAKRLSAIKEQKHLIRVSKALHAFGTFLQIEE